MQTNLLPLNVVGYEPPLAPRRLAATSDRPDVLSASMTDAARRFGLTFVGAPMPALLINSTVNGGVNGEVGPSGPPTAAPSTTRFGGMFLELNQLSRELSKAVRTMAHQSLQNQWRRNWDNPVLVAMNRLKGQPDHFSQVPFVRSSDAFEEWHEAKFAPAAELAQRAADASQQLQAAFGRYQGVLDPRHRSDQDRVACLLNKLVDHRRSDASWLVMADLAVSHGPDNVPYGVRFDQVRPLLRRPWTYDFSYTGRPAADAPGVVGLQLYVSAAVSEIALQQLGEYAKAKWIQAGEPVPDPFEQHCGRLERVADRDLAQFLAAESVSVNQAGRHYAELEHGPARPPQYTFQSHPDRVPSPVNLSLGLR